jgi:hypothetical protein
MNDMERIERNMLRVSDEPLQARVETFNSLMFEFLSKYGSPGIQERLGKLLNKDWIEGRLLASIALKAG